MFGPFRKQDNFLYTSDNENLCVNIDVILVAFLPLLSSPRAKRAGPSGKTF